MGIKNTQATVKYRWEWRKVVLEAKVQNGLQRLREEEEQKEKKDEQKSGSQCDPSKIPTRSLHIFPLRHKILTLS